MEKLEKYSLFVIVPLIVVFLFLSYSKKSAIEQKISENRVSAIPYRGRVVVLNGCGISGAAQDVGTHLRRNGFNVYPPENAGIWTYNRTIVLSLDGNMDLAREVAQSLNTENYYLYKVPNSYYNIRVVVGRDYKDIIN